MPLPTATRGGQWSVKHNLRCLLETDLCDFRLRYINAVNPIELESVSGTVAWSYHPLSSSSFARPRRF